MASVGGSLVFGVDRRLTDTEADRLVLHVCGEAYAFGDASYDAGTGRYTWSGAGLDWSSVTSRTLRLSGPSDTTAPVLAFRDGEESHFVEAGGTVIRTYFSVPIDSGSIPPLSAFAVTADSAPVSVTSTRFSEFAPALLALNVSPRIRRGQTVALSYTDPTPGDDINAIQDHAGNDAASFTVEIFNASTYTGSVGKPAISGTAQVGETLTASPGNIRDPTG